MCSCPQYNWEAAEKLASNEALRQDLKDSMERVKWMNAYTALGETDKALALAINAKEREDIESATPQASCTLALTPRSERLVESSL